MPRTLQFKHPRTGQIIQADWFADTNPDDADLDEIVAAYDAKKVSTIAPARTLPTPPSEKGGLWEGTKSAVGAAFGATVGLPARGYSMAVDELRAALGGPPAETRVGPEANILTGSGIETPGLGEIAMQGLENIADPGQALKGTGERAQERDELLGMGPLASAARWGRAAGTVGLGAAVDPPFAFLGPLAAVAKTSRPAAAALGTITRGLQAGLTVEQIAGAEALVKRIEEVGWTPETETMAANVAAGVGVIGGLEAHSRQQRPRVAKKPAALPEPPLPGLKDMSKEEIAALKERIKYVDKLEIEQAKEALQQEKANERAALRLLKEEEKGASVARRMEIAEEKAQHRERLKILKAQAADDLRVAKRRGTQEMAPQPAAEEATKTALVDKTERAQQAPEIEEGLRAFRESAETRLGMKPGESRGMSIDALVEALEKVDRPTATDTVTLYRGEGPDDAGGAWFTPNQRLAELYARDKPGGRVVAVEVPRADLAKYEPTPGEREYTISPGQESYIGEYRLPPELAANARGLSGETRAGVPEGPAGPSQGDILGGRGEGSDTAPSLQEGRPALVASDIRPEVARAPELQRRPTGLPTPPTPESPVARRIAELPQEAQQQLGELFKTEPQVPEKIGGQRLQPHVSKAAHAVMRELKEAGIAEPSREQLLEALQKHGLRMGSPAAKRIHIAADAIEAELGIKRPTVEEGLTPEGAGISHEELSRAEGGQVYYRVSRSGEVTWQGPKPDQGTRVLRPGEAIVLAQRGKEPIIVNSNNVDSSAALKAFQKFSQGAQRVAKVVEALPEKPGPDAIAELDALVEQALASRDIAPRKPDEVLAELKKFRETATPGSPEAVEGVARLTAELREARAAWWGPETGAVRFGGLPKAPDSKFLEPIYNSKGEVVGTQIDMVAVARSAGRGTKKLIKTVGDSAWLLYMSNLISNVQTVTNNTLNTGVKMGVGTLVDMAMAADPKHKAALSERLRSGQYLAGDLTDTLKLAFRLGETSPALSPGGEQLRTLEQFSRQHIPENALRTWSQFTSDVAAIDKPTKLDVVSHALNVAGIMLERAETAFQVRVSMAPIMKDMGIAPGDYKALIQRAGKDEGTKQRVIGAISQAYGDAQALTYRRGVTRFERDPNTAAKLVDAFNGLPGFKKFAASTLTGQPFVNAFLANAFTDMVEAAPVVNRLSKRTERLPEYLALEEKAGKGLPLTKDERKSLNEFRRNAMPSKRGSRNMAAIGPTLLAVGYLYYMTRDDRELEAHQVAATEPDREGGQYVKSGRGAAGSFTLYLTVAHTLAELTKGRYVEPERGKVPSGWSEVLPSVVQQRGGEDNVLSVLLREAKDGGETSPILRSLDKLAARLGAAFVPAFAKGFGRDRQIQRPELPQYGDTPITSAFGRGIKSELSESGAVPAYDPFTGELKRTGGFFPTLSAPFPGRETKVSKLERFVQSHAGRLAKSGLLPRQTGEATYDAAMFSYWRERLKSYKEPFTIKVPGQRRPRTERLTIPEIIDSKRLSEEQKAEAIERILPRLVSGAQNAAKRAVLDGKATLPVNVKERDLRKLEGADIREEAGQSAKGLPEPPEGRGLKKAERAKWEEMLRRLPK